jgi:hypothetical protein
VFVCLCVCLVVCLVVCLLCVFVLLVGWLHLFVNMCSWVGGSLSRTPAECSV